MTDTNYLQARISDLEKQVSNRDSYIEMLEIQKRKLVSAEIWRDSHKKALERIKELIEVELVEY